MTDSMSERLKKHLNTISSDYDDDVPYDELRDEFRIVGQDVSTEIVVVGGNNPTTTATTTTTTTTTTSADGGPTTTLSLAAGVDSPEGNGASSGEDPWVLLMRFSSAIIVFGAAKACLALASSTSKPPVKPRPIDGETTEPSSLSETKNGVGGNVARPHNHELSHETDLDAGEGDEKRPRLRDGPSPLEITKVVMVSNEETENELKVEESVESSLENVVETVDEEDSPAELQDEVRSGRRGRASLETDAATVSDEGSHPDSEVERQEQDPQDVTSPVEPETSPPSLLSEQPQLVDVQVQVPSAPHSEERQIESIIKQTTMLPAERRRSHEEEAEELVSRADAIRRQLRGRDGFDGVSDSDILRSAESLQNGSGVVDMVRVMFSHETYQRQADREQRERHHEASARAASEDREWQKKLSEKRRQLNDRIWEAARSSCHWVMAVWALIFAYQVYEAFEEAAVSGVFTTFLAKVCSGCHENDISTFDWSAFEWTSLYPQEGASSSIWAWFYSFSPLPRLYPNRETVEGVVCTLRCVKECIGLVAVCLLLWAGNAFLHHLRFPSIVTGFANVCVLFVASGGIGFASIEQACVLVSIQGMITACLFVQVHLQYRSMVSFFLSYEGNPSTQDVNRRMQSLENVEDAVLCSPAMTVACAAILQYRSLHMDNPDQFPMSLF